MEEKGDTLVGRKVPMTSEVFWTSCGPPGGGGGTTRGPAIVGAFNKMAVRLRILSRTKATHASKSVMS